MNARHDNVIARRQRGLTLVELMVASVIIVILILAVGRILTQIQTVVSVSEAAIRSNATATALANVLREDVRQVSQQGFLCITQNPNEENPANGSITTTGNGTPQMFAFCVGSVSSLTGPNPSGATNATTKAPGSIACVGIVFAYDKTPVIWRCKYLLNTMVSGSGVDFNYPANPNTNYTPNSDYGILLPSAIGKTSGAQVNTINCDEMGYFQSLPRVAPWGASTPSINWQITVWQNNHYNSSNPTVSLDSYGRLARVVPYYDTQNPSQYPNKTTLVIPPGSMYDVTAFWKVLAAGATDLSIMWTDGTMTTVNANNTNQPCLNWYGIARVYNGAAPYQIVAKDSNWNNHTIAAGNQGNYIEINADVNSDTNADPVNGHAKYRALFTHDNQGVWPVAIRFRFRLSSAPAEFNIRVNVNGASVDNGTYYEVICPVGQ